MKFFLYRCWIIFYVFINVQEVAAQTGLLWQIDKAGLKPSYLFGTIHSEDTRVTQLPTIVEKCLKNASSVSLEILMDIPTLQKSANTMFFGKEQSLDKLVDQTTYQQVVKALRTYQISEATVKQLKPWAVMATLNMPPPVTGEYLDLTLYQQATQLKIPPYGLEKVEEQLQVFEQMSLANQLILMKDSLKYLDELPKIFEQLHDLYLQRDLTALLKFSQKYVLTHSDDPSLVKSFYKQLVDDRNVKMTNRMLPRLQEGNAFIAVGALHLPGESGILKLLQNLGYRVVALY